MPPDEIRVSRTVALLTSPDPNGATRTPDRQSVLTELRAAKADVFVMTEFRDLLPGPTSNLTNDEVIDLIAIKVVQRQMRLEHIGLCTANKQRFFNWLAAPLSKMAQELQTTQQVMLTMAAKEGGWDKGGLDHNVPLNNPFGVNIIRHREAAGNKGYASLQDAIDYWKGRYAFVRGLKDPDKFVQALLDHGYNTNKIQYKKVFIGLYSDMGRAMLACQVRP